MSASELRPPRGPFSGLTVIDLSHVLAGPFGTTILCDLGARIIKVEPPGHGDDTRTYGPFVKGQSLYFSFLKNSTVSSKVKQRLSCIFGAVMFGLGLLRSSDRDTFGRLRIHDGVPRSRPLLRLPVGRLLGPAPDRQKQSDHEDFQRNNRTSLIQHRNTSSARCRAPI
jgi:CoA-transferase family III